MRTLVIGSLLVLATAASAAPVAAGSRVGHTVACYKKVYIPPTYKARRVLIEKQKRQYEYRNGRIELVEYPPLYREHRTIIKEGYEVLQPVPCS